MTLWKADKSSNKGVHINPLKNSKNSEAIVFHLRCLWTLWSFFFKQNLDLALELKRTVSSYRKTVTLLFNVCCPLADGLELQEFCSASFSYHLSGITALV